MTGIVDGHARPGITRRSLIKAGAMTVAAAAAGCTDSPAGPTSVVSGAGGACSVTPAYHEGPYYLNTGDVRRDVSEGMQGVQMAVRLVMRDAATCEPISDLAVDIWSASPLGVYSGVGETRGSTWLRGRQISSSAGEVRFETLFPGWYPGQPPHFHFTAPFDDRAFTWQFFLDDEFCDAVYTASAPYDTRGVHPARTAGNRPADLIVVPAGTPGQPIIDVDVSIDLDNLSRLAREAR